MESVQLPRGGGVVLVAVVREREMRGREERKYRKGGSEGGKDRDRNA